VWQISGFLGAIICLNIADKGRNLWEIKTLGRSYRKREIIPYYSSYATDGRTTKASCWSVAPFHELASAISRGRRRRDEAIVAAAV